jgi:hypothetical protein
MRRALAVIVAFIAVAAFEFQVFPGHTYLSGETQLYVPILQHLDTPGYLSRDLVATHPNVAYTAYDEITLFLRAAAKTGFRNSLLIQLALSRAASLLGLLLLARAAGLSWMLSLGVAAFLNIGTYLPGADLSILGPEPVPFSIASGFLLLGMGWFASEKPLLAGLCGGIAFLYSPLLASLFWLMALVIFLADKSLRKMVRPALPILLVFALLLGNLGQLQQGAPDGQRFLTKLSAVETQIEQLRTPDLWVSLWPHGVLYLYLAMLVLAIWAAARLWPGLSRPLRWLVLFLPCSALLALCCGELLLSRYSLAWVLRVRPAQSLFYLVLFAWLACSLAAVRAFQQRRRLEAAGWALPCLFFLLLRFAAPVERPIPQTIYDVAAWAENNTWGSSMFLFPEAGKDRYPGVFRAESRRALWVDWQSGRQINYNVSLAPTWKKRWDRDVQSTLTTQSLAGLLSLPIDYYVVNRGTILEAVTQGHRVRLQPAYANRDFSVFEASVLRIAPGQLIVTR